MGKIHAIFGNSLLVPILISVFILFSCDEEFETLKVVSYQPSSAMDEIGEDTIVRIKFNNPVNKSDVEDSFYLESNAGFVDGTISWQSKKSFIFTPRNNLETGSRYTFGLPRTIRDKNNNKMASDFLAEFYVGDEFINPGVTSSTPEYVQGGVTGIPVDQNIIINFDSTMNREKTEAAFNISPRISGYFEWSEAVPGLPDSCLTYVLSSELDYATSYRLTLSTGAVDLAENSIREEYALTFITGDDFEPPVVVGIQEATSIPSEIFWSNSSITNGIEKDISIAVIFSKSMDHMSTESAFSISPSVSGYFVWENQSSKLVFNTLEDLTIDEIYQIRVNSNAKDSNGLALYEPHYVTIRVNGENSQYVRIGNVSGSNNNIDFETIYNINTYDETSWPVPIEMGTIEGDFDDTESDYYLRIQFINNSDPYTPVSMTQYSIFNNYVIESFGILIIDDDPPVYLTDSTSVNINDVTWVDAECTTVQLSLSGLSNDEYHLEPILYRLTLSSGTGGILDEDDNYLENDFVLEFREE